VETKHLLFTISKPVDNCR